MTYHILSTLKRGARLIEETPLRGARLSAQKRVRSCSCHGTGAVFIGGRSITPWRNPLSLMPCFGYLLTTSHVTILLCGGLQFAKLLFLCYSIRGMKFHLTLGCSLSCSNVSLSRRRVDKSLAPVGKTFLMQKR